MNAPERYKTDAQFAMLVNLMLRLFEEQLGSGAGITPSEIREASGYAWQIYHMRHIDPIMLVPRP